MSDVPPDREPSFSAKALEAAIRIALVGLLVLWCFTILKPFLVLVLWGGIIAIGVFPLYRRLLGALGGRAKTAAALFTLVGLALLITPAVLLAGSAIQGVQTITEQIQEGTLTVPPPPEKVATWPLVGEDLDRIWNQASVSLEGTIHRAEPQLRQHAAKLISAAAGIGTGVLHFAISIVIAGVFLARSGEAKNTAVIVANRLTARHGVALVELARATVTSVVQGVLGVAIIQSLLAGAGLLAAGVPAAGLWAVLVLVVAVAQLPPLLILGPVAIYVFSSSSTTVAVLFLIWSILVSFSDGLLKPMLLGRGVDVPMLVILLGAIGGMITYGIIGLFVGAVVLALTYKLFRGWVELESGEHPHGAVEDEAEGAPA